jgi:hypothetical protein
MTNGLETRECSECVNWDKVKDRVRIHSVFTSLMDKIEAKLRDDEFKATTGDLLKVWDAIHTMEEADGGSKGSVLGWADQPVNLNA